MEPYQSFDVLGSGSPEELLLNELQSAQTQAVKADATLQLCEWRFDFLQLPLSKN
jgi:hypothetical protein